MLQQDTTWDFEEMPKNLLLFFYKMGENTLICHQTQMYILNLSDIYWWSLNIQLCSHVYLTMN